MQRADEVAIARRAVVIDLARGPGIGDGERAAVAKADAAMIDGILAVAGRQHVDGHDVGPQPAALAAFGLPENCGVAPGVEQRHAMVGVAPEEALVVQHKVQVIGCR